MTFPDSAVRALARQNAAADRAALLAALPNMPQAMRDKPQWLVWKFMQKPGATKPAKVPFYVSGSLRGWPHGKPKDGKPTAQQPQVEQGHELDRAALCTFDVALAKLAAMPALAGVGFAFLPGDGLIGVDIDHAIDRSTGQVSDLCAKVVDLCASYTEFSPSGTGVHIILAGESEKFKDDLIGLEVYAQSQYFACTGHRWESAPDQVQPADPVVMAYLRTLVDESKAAQAHAKEAARQAAKAQAEPAPSPAPTPHGVDANPQHAATSSSQHGGAPGQQGNDFRAVNDAAHQALAKWVPQLFPRATEWGGGYRVTSKNLGRDLQEDLQLLPAGIMDFGEECGMSPIDVVLKWGPGLSKPLDALRWLATQIGLQLTPPARRVQHAPAPAEPPPGPPPEGTADRPEPPAAQQGAEDAGSNVVSLEAEKRARAPKPGKGSDDAPPADEPPGDDKPRKKLPKETWELVEALCARYALIYSTDSAWDRAELIIVRVAALRLAWGKTAVNLWLSRPPPQRVMIRPIDLVFEPGAQVQEPAINMFCGLELQPADCEAADVEPMLRLLRHLCGESALASRKRGDAEGAADDVDAVMHWVMCWMALPLQRLGTKMSTALVFHGAQGTGKNLFFDLWRDLYGVYGVTVGQTELEDKFNGWISRKLAIIGDEVVSRQEMYHNKNRLKLVVTQQDKFPIRGMQMETRWESNHANVVFLSNESQPIPLEERDRRYLVVYTPLEADVALYDAVRAFKDAGGAAKWLHYLLHYPVGDFSAHTKPLMTHAKADLIEAAWKPPQKFANDWLEGMIDLPVRLCAVEQLYKAFRRWCDVTGAKWPPEQSMFTTEVNRWVRERVQRGSDGKHAAPQLVYKVVAVQDVVDPNRIRRSVRVFIPHGSGVPDGAVDDDGRPLSEGKWALQGIEAFKADLRAYLRPRDGAQGDDE